MTTGETLAPLVLTVILGLVFSKISGSLYTGFSAAIFFVLWFRWNQQRSSNGKSKIKAFRFVNHRFKLKLLQTVFFNWRYRKVYPKFSKYAHAIIVGQSGSGKSESVKLAVHVELAEGGQGSIVLVDGHGDLASEISRFKHFQRNPEKLVYVSGKYLDSGYSVSLNPLEHNFHNLPPHKRYRRLSVKVQELTTAFEALFRDSFTHHQKSLLKHAFWLLLEQPNPCLLDLMELATPSNRSKFLEMAGSHSLPNVREWFENVYPDPKLDVTLYSVLGRLNDVFDSFAVRQFLGAKSSSIDFSKMLNSNKVIVFDLSQSVYGKDGVRIIGAMILSMIGDFSLRRAECSFRLPVTVIADECSLYATSSIAKYLDESRKYGVFFHLLTQRLGQFQGDGLKRLRDAALSSAVRVIGHSTKKDLKQFADEMGVDAKEVKPLLTAGTFLLQTGQRKPIVYRAPSMLVVDSNSPVSDHPYYMHDDIWKDIEREQIARYYQPISQVTLSATTPVSSQSLPSLTPPML